MSVTWNKIFHSNKTENYVIAKQRGNNDTLNIMEEHGVCLSVCMLYTFCC